MLLLGLAIVSSSAALILLLLYLKFAGLTDRRLEAGAFAETVNILSAPRTVGVGDSLTAEDVLAQLRHSGYTTSRSNPLGWYNVRPGAVEIFPGRDSYNRGEPGVLEFEGGKIARIVSLGDNTERERYQLEPQLIANLSENRAKRRLVRFADIPSSLVNAVVSIEDKHFFQHAGFDLLRILKAAWVDLKNGRKEQGASTLSMQLARGFWLDPDKRWKRKLEELLITVHIEHRLSKQQIFEYYTNEVYLGRRGTFSVNGFGEGARAFFGKDLSQVTVSQAALLAGLVQRPSYYNPYRYPDRARARRDVVLAMMRQNGYLDDAQYRTALAEPLEIAPEHSGGSEGQYFLDMVSDELQTRLDDHEKQVHYIYTTIDPELQRASEEAVRAGMDEVDRQLRKRAGKEAIPPGQPQVALVALDPHTGEIRALVGGRDYDSSQLNHAVAMRPPGSVFKPFVYAAALETAVTGGQHILTPATLVNDAPTTFAYGNHVYQPGNFRQDYMGEVTLRTALAHSLNIAAVAVAQQVGLRNVLALALRAGFNDKMRATPALALGAYDATPLEVAGAYTIFANGGMRLAPTAISLVRGLNGRELYRHRPEAHGALDPRVAYLMTSMLEEVLRSGTGAGTRARGFHLPAAGKTGTSHDGWFAGYTSQLLAVVWVGFDDYRDLRLEGAHSALPVWTEFMKRASRMRGYRDARTFQPPSGVVAVQVCADSGQLAGSFCPNPRSESFVDGTQPVVDCQMHGFGFPNYAERGLEDEVRPLLPGITASPGAAGLRPATAGRPVEAK
jgi:penicillin-binding protein 1B